MELFNIAEDISETTNLLLENPEKAKEMAADLSDYLKSVNAQMPKKKESGEQIPFPIEVLK